MCLESLCWRSKDCVSANIELITFYEPVYIKCWLLRINSNASVAFALRATRAIWLLVNNSQKCKASLFPIQILDLNIQIKLTRTSPKLWILPSWWLSCSQTVSHTEAVFDAIFMHMEPTCLCTGVCDFWLRRRREAVKKPWKTLRSEESRFLITA